MGIPNILHENLTININFAQYSGECKHIGACIDFRDMVVFEKYIPRDDDDNKRRRKIQISLVLQFPHQRARTSARSGREIRLRIFVNTFKNSCCSSYWETRRVKEEGRSRTDGRPVGEEGKC